MAIVLGLILSFIIAFFYACTKNTILKVIFLLLILLVALISFTIDLLGIVGVDEFKKSLMSNFTISKKNTFEDEKKIKINASKEFSEDKNEKYDYLIEELLKESK